MLSLYRNTTLGLSWYNWEYFNSIVFFHEFTTNISHSAYDTISIVIFTFPFTVITYFLCQQSYYSERIGRRRLSTENSIK